MNIEERIKELQETSDIDRCEAWNLPPLDFKLLVSSIEDEDLLEKLSHSRYAVFRREIASNSHCSEETLRRLMLEERVTATRARRSLVEKLARRDGVEESSFESKLIYYDLEDWNVIRSWIRA